MINREQIINEFEKYVAPYDRENEKIKLKVEHTYRVADICHKIAVGLGLEAYDVDLAWLIGMLHDIGRFEQLRRYNTFADADSIDHAHFAVELLFGEEVLGEDNPGEDSSGKDNPEEDSSEEDSSARNSSRSLITSFAEGLNSEDITVLRKSIWNHSAYRVEEGLTERELLFAKIIRDGDKVDIFKVIADIPMETIYDVSTEEVRLSTLSDEVLEAFHEEHAVLRSLKKTPLDFQVAHIALAFELEFPVSVGIAKEQGYLQKLMNHKPEDEKTASQYAQVVEHMQRYLQENAEN